MCTTSSYFKIKNPPSLNSCTHLRSKPFYPPSSYTNCNIRNLEYFMYNITNTYLATQFVLPYNPIGCAFFWIDK